MTCRHLYLLLMSLLVGSLVQLRAPQVRGDGELPAALRKAWEEREAQAARIQVKFTGLANYVAPFDDEDGTIIKLPEPLPRAGVMLYEGTKLRFEESGQWPWNRKGEVRKVQVWNDFIRGGWTQYQGLTNATLSKSMPKAKSFESCLQPLFWTVRPTTSMLGQWGVSKLSVGEATLPKLEGKCYLLTEAPIGKGSRVTWWIHQATATVRQVEYLNSETRTLYSLDYDLKDSPWIPSRWSEVLYEATGEIEIRFDFQIESVSFPRTIEPETFVIELKPGMQLMDATQDPVQVFEIDEQGKRVRVKPE